MSNIMRGTVLLTGASFLSKFLGMIYVIPFHHLVGSAGGALFQLGYTPYSIFISLSTIGVPMAVSKFVSKYNSLGDYETGMRMFKAGLALMSITGVLAFLALFFSAEFLAGQMITSDDPESITVADVTFVIRTVSVALLVIPAMSIARGFFQGHQSFGPTSVSQVIEQIVRIAFVLGGSFVIIRLLSGTVTAAVGFSTFAAFLGALASCAVLYTYWRKRRPYINRQRQQQTYTHDMPTGDLFKELFRYAGPFVFVGLAIPLYQLTDQFTFERAMVAIGQEEIWAEAFATINFYGHKLAIIPVTLATGLSIAAMPALTKSFFANDKALVTKQINQAFQVILVLIIPAVVGLSLLSDEAYGALYGMENIEITGNLLGWYAPVALFFALYTVSSAVLQGINEQRYAVYSLAAGLFLKVLLNIQLIHTFGAKGAIFGTALAAVTSVILNLWRIKVAIDFSYRKIVKRTMLIGIFVAIMAAAVLLLKLVFGLFIPYEETRWGAIVMLGIGVIGGASIYLWFAYQSTLLERALGSRIKVLDKIFRR